MSQLVGKHDRVGPRRWAVLKVVSALIFCCFVGTSIATAQMKEIRRNLILNLLEPLSSPGVDVIDQAIVDGLENSPYQIQLFTETLSPSLYPDATSRQELREWYVRKYRGREPDVILAVGPTPLEFMAESHNQLFPGTPVIYCATTEEMLREQKLDSRFTGVIQKVEAAKTLEAALKLQPGTKHVFVVGGVGKYDQYLEATARESQRKYESRVNFTYLTDLAMPALLERLRHLPPHAIVYHASMMQDAAGKVFIDATQAVPMVAAAANAPVFTMDDVDIGRGTLGECVMSYAEQGRLVAELALRVLNGEKPQNIPPVRASNVYMFDWRVMRRWGIREKDLPPGSILLNRQPTAWELYKWYIVTGAFLVLIETLAIAGLFWERKRRKTAVQSLREQPRF